MPPPTQATPLHHLWVHLGGGTFGETPILAVFRNPRDLDGGLAGEGGEERRGARGGPRQVNISCVPNEGLLTVPAPQNFGILIHLIYL